MVLTRSMAKTQSTQVIIVPPEQPRRVRQPRQPRQPRQQNKPTQLKKIVKKSNYMIKTEFDRMYSQFESDWNEGWFDRCCKKYGNVCAPVVHEIISNHPNLKWETIQANPDFPWDWYGISFHKNITWEIIQENPKMPWKYYSMTANPNITEEIIRDNPDKKWNQEYIKCKYDYSPTSFNQGLTETQIYDSIMEKLSDNEDEKQEYITNKFRQWFETSDLKHELLAVVWHPDNFSYFQYLDSDFKIY